MAFDDYENHDALALAALIRNRQVSALEVLEAAISRIEARNPTLNAVVQTCYDRARQQIKDGLPPGPFAGVPFLLKDLYFSYAGLPTTSGSRLFADFIPAHHSTVVERHLAAGLVILGKTNTPEFGLCPATEPLLYGPTVNPWQTALSAGGSSGGAAAAVAGGMLPLAHATDGGGSIRIPAANCGLFGLKPTRARNPAGPDFGEVAAGLSASHGLSRSVRDSAALLDATHGYAPGDPYSAPPPPRPFLDEVGRAPGRLRIALATHAPDGAPLHPDCANAVQLAGHLCADLGHYVEPAAPRLDIAAIAQVWRVLTGVGLWHALSRRLAMLGRALRPEDVEPITLLWAEEGRRVTGDDYLHAIQLMHQIGRQVAAFFADYDVLLSSTLTSPPLPLGALDMTGTDLDAYYHSLMQVTSFTPLFNLSGGPAMSVPLHWTAAGLPVGVHIGADYGAEGLLFRLAAQLESARPWFDRRPAAF